MSAISDCKPLVPVFCKVVAAALEPAVSDVSVETALSAVVRIASIASCAAVRLVTVRLFAVVSVCIWLT